jgi:hypothetical protein
LRIAADIFLYYLAVGKDYCDAGPDFFTTTMGCFDFAIGRDLEEVSGS